MRLDLERTRSGGMAVTVELGNQRVRAALDTGATITMISPRLAGRLELTPHARSSVVDAAGRERPLLIAGPVALRWGNVATRLALVAWSPDRGEVPGADGLEAVLGADALAGVDVLIDALRGRMWVAASGTLAAWVEGEEVALRSIGTRVAVEIELVDRGREPMRLPLIIDSGASAPVMFGSAATAMLNAGGFSSTSTLATAGGFSKVRTVTLGRARIGSRSVRLGQAALLPEVTDREEAGLVPLTALGPTLIEVASSRALLGARLRPAPRADVVAAGAP
jgi:predicted aspartyl protease